jgi:phospholipid-binding lipoprotein MlaA
MLRQSAARMALGLTLLAALSGCVTLPPNHPRAPQDPWESWNRGVYKFNDVFDRAIAKPVTRTYVRVVPHPIRTGVSNFFANLTYTTVMINDALQGKFRAAGNDLGRFLVNSTFGVGGVLDPASSLGLARNNEDFGQTLGHWGVHPGPFVELPVLGPSDLRDAPSRVVDTYTSPWAYIHNDWWKYGLYLPYFIDERAALLPLDETLKNVYDPYAFIRDAYLQRRAYLVSDGKISNQEPLEDPGEDESAPKGGSPPAAAPAATPPAAPATTAPASPPEPSSPPH